jgi:hypothetical protein
MKNYRSLLHQLQDNVTDGLSVRIPKTWKQGYAENRPICVSRDVEERTRVGNTIEEIIQDNIPSKKSQREASHRCNAGPGTSTPVGINNLKTELAVEMQTTS